MNSRNSTSTDLATTSVFWSLIKLNPDGEISTWNFLLQHTSIQDTQQRAFSCYIQGFINTVFTIIFLRNTWHALELVYFKHKSAASWCCFLQALMGLIVESINALAILPGAVSCRLTIWMTSFDMTVSSICVSICLLLQAYIIMNNNRVLLALSILLMIPLSGSIWIG
jgi:hypothetical protein